MDCINADSRPSTKQLLPYLADMAPSWYKVGAVLLEVNEESRLKLIQANNGSDMEKCCLCMLQYWMEAHPKATWHHLITALKSPGVNLSFLASKIEDNFTVDHIQRSDESSAIVNFAESESVLDAFAVLIRIFTDELSGAKFATIRTVCLSRACKRLRSEIRRTTNVDSLFELLACSPLYFNWMKVEYLQAIAAASGIAKLKETLKCYTDVILSKKLGEIWNDIPSFHKIKAKYYFRVKAKFHRKNPDKIQVKDLKKYEPRLAMKMALHIMRIEKGSLTITWFIAAEEAYEAYLSALNIPQELREDDFLQIGMWVAYHPQSVIPELERAHTMMPTTTLLIGYYHGLLLNNIDADLLIDKMCSVGLLTAHEQNAISSGHSVYHKNWLLLEHVRQMKVQAVMTFCDLIQQIWPQIGVQLITALKYSDVLASDRLHTVTSEVKWDDVKVADIKTTSSVQLLFLHLIDQICNLLQKHRLELIQQCKSLNASDTFRISLFSADQIIELSECSNLLVKLCPLFTWSNCSVLKTLSVCSSNAIKLLDKFESSLDPLQPITSYPVPHLSSNMIPADTSSYTILAIRCDKELYQCTLQYVYDVQSVMVERCDITQHCLQLLAVRNDPSMLYWTFSKCVVDLINTNIPLHSDYLYSRGILEVLVYPDLLLTTGDDVCYGSLAFDCSDQLFSEELEISDIATDDKIKDNSTEDILKHVYSQCDSLRNELQEKTKYSARLEESLNALKKPGDDQTHEEIMTTEDSSQTGSITDELGKKLTPKAVDENEELKENVSRLKKNHENLIAENQIAINKLNEEIDEKNADLKMRELKEEKLKKENDHLHQLVNKYRVEKVENKISVGCQTEEVYSQSDSLRSELEEKTKYSKFLDETLNTLEKQGDDQTHEKIMTTEALTGGNNSEQQVECSKLPKISSDNGVNQPSIKRKESHERNPFSEDREESSDQPSIEGKKPDEISPSSESSVASGNPATYGYEMPKILDSNKGGKKSSIQDNLKYNRRLQQGLKYLNPPPLPSNNVDRQSLLDDIAAKLLQGNNDPNKYETTVTITGAGGFGKTTTVISLCYHPIVHNQFTDGFLFIELGPQATDASVQLRAIYNLLTDQQCDINVVEQKVNQLTREYYRNLLVIIDDVWHVEDAEPLVKAFSNCKIILTTRMIDIEQFIPSQNSVTIGPMIMSEAISLLTKGIIDNSQLSQEDVSLLNELAEDVHLWPLLLSLIRGQLSHNLKQHHLSYHEAIQTLQTKLHQKGLTAFDKKNITTISKSRKLAVKACIEMTLELLTLSLLDKIKTLILWTGIGTSLQTAVLNNLWNISKQEAQDIVDVLWVYGLVQFTDIAISPKNIKQQCVEVHAIISQYITECIDSEEVATLSPFGELNTLDSVNKGLLSTFQQSYGVHDSSSLTAVDYLKYKLSEIENVVLPYNLKSINMLSANDPHSVTFLLQRIKEAIMSSPNTMNLLSSLVDQINSLQGECKQIMKNVNKLCRKLNQSVQRNLCEQKYDELIQTVEEFIKNYPLCILAQKVVTMVKKIIPYCDGELLHFITMNYEGLQIKTPDYHAFTTVMLPTVKLYIKQHDKITTSLHNGSPDIELTYHYFRSGKYSEEVELVENNYFIKLLEVAPNLVQKHTSQQ